MTKTEQREKLVKATQEELIANAPGIDARNNWLLLNLRASILFDNYIDYAPRRTQLYWDAYQEYVDAGDIKMAFAVTEYFRLTFKRG